MTEWNALNNQAEGAIQVAGKWDSTETLLWILDQLPAPPSNAMLEALSGAIEHKNYDIAKILIEHKANGFDKPQGKDSPLRAATAAGHVDLVSAILR